MAVTAIFGGTFNPFHIGHYEMLKALSDDGNVEKILLMPDRIPPHKVCDFLASDSDRIGMCSEIIKEFPKAELCLIEFEREGKSYSYYTVVELQKKFPNTDFAFVCGGDMLATFDEWHRYTELMEIIPFIVFKRSDTDLELFNTQAERFISMGMRLTISDKTIPSVSSTFIRNNIEKATNLLPKAILKFITDRGIYNAK